MWNKELTPEGIVKRGIIQYLRYRGWKVKRIVQGALSEPGLPDLFAFKGGKVIFIEAKTKTGKMSSAQKAFQLECEEQNVTYLVCRDFEELKVLGY